jgi:hypothetical protein
MTFCMDNEALYDILQKVSLFLIVSLSFGSSNADVPVADPPQKGPQL